jgi:ABC-type proline/glycine betaine transport system permease subunit
MRHIEQLIRIGWYAVEAALVLVLLCVLLGIVLGNESGPFIAGVAGNATRFLQTIPSGTFLALVLIAVLYAWFRARRHS